MGELISVVNDYRVRFGGEVLPGDYARRKGGTTGIVTKVFEVEGRLAFLTAPEEMVDRAAYLSGALDHNGAGPIRTGV